MGYAFIWPTGGDPAFISPNQDNMSLVAKGLSPHFIPGSPHCQPGEPFGKSCFICGVVAPPLGKSDKSDDTPRHDVNSEFIDNVLRHTSCDCVRWTCSLAAQNPISDEPTTVGSEGSPTAVGSASGAAGLVRQRYASGEAAIFDGISQQSVSSVDS